MQRMSALTLICLCTSGAYSDSHFLYYYYTGVTDPGSGLPEFSMVGYMDDQQVELYSSDIGQNVPVAQWMKENEIPEYWEGLTRLRLENEAFFRHELKIAVKRLNLTEGLHYVQAMLGCELREDGSTIGFNEYSNDGREFMYLDLQTAMFIPTMAEAQIITQKWNSPDSGIRERVKYNDITCIDRLKRYLKYGRKHLERRVRPGVKVSGRESGEVTKLHCHVYGFHPRQVHVKWMKNGEDDIPSYETTHALPNPDGTYQIRVTVEVIPKEGESYSCYVDHSSLEEPLLVKWEPKQDYSLAVIISVVVISVLTAVIAGVIIYKKKQNYTAASTSDRSSDASDRSSDASDRSSDASDRSSDASDRSSDASDRSSDASDRSSDANIPVTA